MLEARRPGSSCELYELLRIICIAVISSGLCFSQSAGFTLSSGSSAAGGTATLALSLSAANALPAGLQWTLNYATTDVTAVTVTASAAATSAGKTLYCSPNAGSIMCLLVGMNSNVIPNGVVANVILLLAAAPSRTPVPVTVTGAVTASDMGSGIATTATAGSVTVAAPGSLTSLACSPASLVSPGATACTATLSQAAPAGGASVAISPNNAAVTTPASVVVPAGSSSVSFAATTGDVSASTTVAIGASWNGSSVSTSVTLLPGPPALASVTCGASSATAGAVVPCAVTLTKIAAPTGTATAVASLAVRLASSSAAVVVPAAVTIPPGSSSAGFNATVGRVTATSVTTITGTLKTIAKATTITVNPPPASLAVSTLNCAETDLMPGGATDCIVTLSAAAPGNGATIDLAGETGSSLSPTLSVPSSVTVAAGSTSARFTAMALANAPGGAARLNASLGPSSASASIVVRQLKPVMFRCSPAPLKAGALLMCKVDLNGKASTPVTLALSSSARGIIRVPDHVVVERASKTVRFVAFSQADAPDATVNLTATLGSAAASTSLQVLGAGADGSEVRTRTTADTVPVIEKVVNAATLSSEAVCSPGGAATIIGSGLDTDAGVTVNGDAVPVLVGSVSRVTFQCPEVAAGTPLDIVVRTTAGSSAPGRTVMREATPGIFTTDGSGTGYGSAVFRNTGDLAVPSRPGSVISIYCTGLGPAFGPENLTAALPVALMDGIAARVLSATRIQHGVYRIDLRIPEVLRTGALPLELSIPTMDGKLIQGNRAAIAVELAPEGTTEE